MLQRLSFVFLITAVAPVWPLSNCVTIQEASAGAQNDRPITLSRFFGRGDISNYPKPVVDGAAPNAWQADVKTRWQDGSVQHAFISWRQTFAANQSRKACFENSVDSSSDPSNPGLTQQQMADYDTGGGTGSWGARIETSLAGITNSVDARTMISNGKWTYWLRGPVVTRVIAEDLTPPQPAYDFGYEYDFAANASDGWTAALGQWLNSTAAKWNDVHWKPAYVTGDRVAKGAVTTLTMNSHGMTNGQQAYIYTTRTDSWTAVRNTFTITVVDANTFTITVDSSAWATPVAGDYFYVAAPRFQLGFGSANTCDPSYALAVDRNGTQYRLLVRDNGTTYTSNLDSLLTHNIVNYPHIVRFIADGPAQKITVAAYYPGSYRSRKLLTICTSGCSINVSAGFFSQSWVPLRVNTDASGNAVPVQEATLYRGSRWKEPTDNKFKSFHPIFSVAFYPAVGATPRWGGVEYEAILENPWVTKFQSIPLENLSVKSGQTGSTTVLSKNYWQFSARKAFSRLAWSGAAPAAIHVDHNLQYMVYSRIVPPLRHNEKIQSSTLSGWINSYNSNLANGDDRQHCWTTTTDYCGLWQKYIPGPGGRQDISVIPGWHAGYLYAMGDTAMPLSTKMDSYEKLVQGQADVFFGYSMHYRESDTTFRTGPAYGKRYFYHQDSGSLPAFGHPVSFSARPTFQPPLDFVNSSTAAPDILPKICTSDPCKADMGFNVTWPEDLHLHAWSAVDPSHWPSAFLVPYVLTGRYSYLLGQIYSGAMMVGFGSPYSPLGESGCSTESMRCGDWGLAADTQGRSVAWRTREFFVTYLLLPDDSPYKGYHQHIVKRNDEMWEGIHNIRTGNFSGPFSCTPTAGIGTYTRIWYGSNAYGNLPIPNAGFNTREIASNGRMRWVMAPLGAVVDGTGFRVEVSTDGGSTWTNRTTGQWGVDTGRDWYWEAGTPVVRQDPSATPTPYNHQVRVTARVGTIPNAWCYGWHAVSTQQPTGVQNGLTGPHLVGSTQDAGTIDQRLIPRPGYLSATFMQNYTANVVAYMYSLGLPYDGTGKKLFQHSGAKYLRWLVDGTLNNEGFDFQFLDTYFGVSKNHLGGYMQTWADYGSYYVKDWRLNGNITGTTTTLPFIVGDPIVQPYVNYNSSNGYVLKIDNEFLHVDMTESSWPRSTATGTGTVIGGVKGRGILGTVPAAHSTGAAVRWYRTGFIADFAGGYPATYGCALSQLDDMAPGAYGSPRAAFERFWSNVSRSYDWVSGYPAWSCYFRDRVENVRVMPSANSVTILYSAPSGESCRYLVAPAITSSDDTTDTADSGGARGRQATVNGLQPATTYRYRITCGAGRATGMFSTP